jgi:hypothetical protein
MERDDDFEGEEEESRRNGSRGQLTRGESCFSNGHPETPLFDPKLEDLSFDRLPVEELYMDERGLELKNIVKILRITSKYRRS